MLCCARGPQAAAVPHANMAAMAATPTARTIVEFMCILVFRLDRTASARAVNGPIVAPRQRNYTPHSGLQQTRPSLRFHDQNGSTCIPKLSMQTGGEAGRFLGVGPRLLDPKTGRRLNCPARLG